MIVFIIDDEISACRVLEKLLRKIVPEGTVIQTFDSSEIALCEIKKEMPELIFLDIEMPNINGFQLLMELGDIDTEIIFTTAYEQYAIKAIKFSALDYILKPIDRYELDSSFKRFLERKSKKTDQMNSTLLSHLQHNLSIGKDEKFKLVISVKEGHFRVDQSDIIFIEAQNNYSKFYFTNRKPILVSKTLKEYNDILSSEDFIRTHKSYLVNKAHIEFIKPDGEIVMTNNLIAQVSRRNIADLKDNIRH